MSGGGKLIALVLVFAAVCASAGTCADGSSPGSNGCCAATNECPPPPCLAKAVSGSGSESTCTCSGCVGDTVTIEATCTSDSCAARSRSGIKWGDCEYCSGSDGTCMPDEAAVTACGAIMPGISIASDGLISASASASGGNTCGACCPAGVCNSVAAFDKPECAACLACNTKGTVCPKDSAAASLGSGALGMTLLAVTTTALLRGLLF